MNISRTIQYFVIKSQLNGLVLDVEGGNGSSGTALCMWHPKSPGDNDNQLFYAAPQTGTLRAKCNNMALDASGDHVVCNTYSPYNQNQQWIIQGQCIVNRNNPYKVLDIIANNSQPGARVCAYDYKGGSPNQSWTIEYQVQGAGRKTGSRFGQARQGIQVSPAGRSGHFNQPPPYGMVVPPQHIPASGAFGFQSGYHLTQPQPMGYQGAVQYFMIKSHLNGLVLDVEGESKNPGTAVCMWHPKARGSNDNQLFYTDPQTGTLRAKCNNMALDASGAHVVFKPYSPYNQNQQWIIQGQSIANQSNPFKVLDIIANNSSPGAHVCAYDYKGGSPNQSWTIEHQGF